MDALLLSKREESDSQSEKKCILCAKLSGKVTGSDDGRAKIQDAAEILVDTAVLSKIHQNSKFVYHVKPAQCYSKYILRAQRAKKSETTAEKAVSSNEKNILDESYTPPKRRKLSAAKTNHTNEQKCIICDREREGSGSRSRKLYRISEQNRARLFLNAINFNNDDVKTRCIFMHNIGDVFAADVSYHNNCLRSYFSNYKDKVETLFEAIEKSNEAATMDANCKLVFDSLDFETTGYSITCIREMINENLPQDQLLDNRLVKVLLIRYFKDSICFTYPSEKRLSQMVYSGTLLQNNVIEAIRRNTTTYRKDFSEELLKECKGYDFGLNDTLCTNEDIEISMKNYKAKRPAKWLHFVRSMFSKTSNTSSDEWLIRFDTLFQFMHYWLNPNRNITPLHVTLTQTIHNLTKSRQVIDILNNLNIAISYDSMKRIDTAIAQQLIDDTLPNRCPVSSRITRDHLIQGAIDNFDHTENTASGSDSTHDTVLVLFQNQPRTDVAQQEIQMTHRSSIWHHRRLCETLPCQVLVKSKLAKGSGSIPLSFSPTPYNDLLKNSVDDDYFLWCLARKKWDDTDDYAFPGFVATMSALQHPRKFGLTVISFAPILPYIATDIDSIYTSMINFQDVLMQKGAASGVLWADEGVYSIAKEIQLLKPDQFSNIFLGMGPFHVEKIIISCLGKFLSVIGMDLALVESKVFGKTVVEKCIMNGGHYTKGKEAMHLIAEVMTTLMIEQFQAVEQPEYTTEDMEQKIGELTSIADELLLASEVDRFKELWLACTSADKRFHTSFLEWRDACAENCQNLKYWKVFVFQLFPVLRDMTLSVRQGNWELFVSSLRRSMPLFFAFGRTNYCRWGSLFLEECLQLSVNFPSIYSAFQDGGWVMYHTERQGSAVGFDMALEKCYNKTAKIVGGIIGITRQKEAVALWNLLKHEKDLHAAHLKEWCGMVENDPSELSLHHEFNLTAATRCQIRAKALLDYIKSICNPFAVGPNLRNIATGIEVGAEISESLTDCLYVGEKLYQEHIQSRMVKHDKRLHDTIKKSSLAMKLSSSVKPQLCHAKDTAETSRYIEYARERGINMTELLRYELTSTSHYLVNECDGKFCLKKPDKASLSRALVQALPENKRDTPAGDCDLTIIDFMALVRSLPIKKMSLKTFGDLAERISSLILQKGSHSHRIDVIFDAYTKQSLKQSERFQRQASSPIHISITSAAQNLPQDLSMFWSSVTNKMALQNFVFDWMVQNINTSHEIYFGGVHGYECRKLSMGEESQIDDLCSRQEEADERIMFHIHDSVFRCHVSSIIVHSCDTDVFVMLLYHFQNNWRSNLEKLFIRLGGSQSTRKTVPVHLLNSCLSHHLVSSLPAVHALSGCDTTSKVGPKLAAIRRSIDLSLLCGFGVDTLTSQMVSNAENFLVSSIKRTDCQTFDELRWEQYHDSQKTLDFRKLVCCSTTIKEHIKRAYLQCKMWLEAVNPTLPKLNPTEYGYKNTAEGLQAVILSVDHRPNYLPPPCSCPKSCSRATCNCRKHGIKCVLFCKCKPDKCTNSK